jgi:hypothetical protein
VAGWVGDAPAPTKEDSVPIDDVRPPPIVIQFGRSAKSALRVNENWARRVKRPAQEASPETAP